MTALNFTVNTTAVVPTMTDMDVIRSYCTGISWVWGFFFVGAFLMIVAKIFLRRTINHHKLDEEELKTYNAIYDFFDEIVDIMLMAFCVMMVILLLWH